MSEHIEREKYCAEVCRCNKEKCDKSKCPVWNAPAADVAYVAHAKWAEVMFRDRFNARYWEYLCSSCNRYANREYDYCPNCGAKMDLEEDE